MVIHVQRCSKNSKAAVGKRKPKLQAARQTRHIQDVPSHGFEEFDAIPRNASKKIEIPVEQQ